MIPVRFKAIVVLALGLSFYQLAFDKWLWTPDGPLRREIQRLVSGSAKVAANEQREIDDALLAKQSREKHYDPAATRAAALQGAEKARSLNETWEDATAVAKGARMDGIREGVVPPPPPPPPPQPVFSQLMTKTVYGDAAFVLPPSTSGTWVSFRQKKAGSFGIERNVLRAGFFGPLRVKTTGRITGKFSPSRAIEDSVSIDTDPDGMQLPNREWQKPLLPKVLSHAPYMALLGRTCRPVDEILERDNSPYSHRLVETNLQCSSPFLLGRNSILCPGNLPTGELQFALNDFVSPGDAAGQGALMDGAHYISTEPAPTEACGADRDIIHVRQEADAVAEGAVLNIVDNRISSRQHNWRPFDVAVNRPLRLKAWGQMQPRAQSAFITGPEGLTNADAYRQERRSDAGLGGPIAKWTLWVDPVTGFKFDDANFQLYQRTFPFQALIARLCTGNDCTEPFLVGDSAIVCSRGRQSDHLELWTNQLAGLSAADNPDPRLGEYLFEISAASASEADACNKRRTNP